MYSFLAVIKVNGSIMENLVGFMPFTGNYHNIASARRADGVGNSFMTLDDNIVFTRPFASCLDAHLNLLADLYRVFTARIVRRNDDPIGKPSRNFAHDRTLSL